MSRVIPSPKFQIGEAVTPVGPYKGGVHDGRKLMVSARYYDETAGYTGYRYGTGQYTFIEDDLEIWVKPLKVGAEVISTISGKSGLIISIYDNDKKAVVRSVGGDFCAPLDFLKRIDD